MADESSQSRSRRSSAAGWTTGELISLCLTGEDAAWQEFLNRYSRLIYSTILKEDLSQDDQEEAFQASVMAIYCGLPQLRDHSRLISWIIAITWRQAINSIRHRSREARVRKAADAIGHEAGDQPLAPEALVALERAQQAQEALAALPERCRRLLTGLFYEDPRPGYDEIAHRMGIPIGSLGPTRARCLERMRRYFEERNWIGP